MAEIFDFEMENVIRALSETNTPHARLKAEMIREMDELWELSEVELCANGEILLNELLNAMPGDKQRKELLHLLALYSVANKKMGFKEGVQMEYEHLTKEGRC